MKKALLLILGIIAVCFLIANADYLSDFLNTMMTGALVPIIISIVLMIGRHLVQAESYNAAFEAVGHKTGFWHNVVLIFSLVFINTFCLFSGATGVAFIIDDAHREGCDAGQSTGGAILSQIGYFAAVFVISVIGFLTMWISGHMNTLFLIGGLVLAGVLVILSSLFFIMAAYSTRSPYAEVGAARETLQVMCYEPMVLLMAVAFFQATGSFDVAAVLDMPHPVVCTIGLVFLGVLFILTIKLRKSPFDLALSHHAHQEIVRGVTTEMSGPTLGLVEIMHWCENVLFMGWIAMFFVWGSPASALVAVAVVALVYFLEIWIDNNFARVKWQFMFKSAWLVALVAGGVNIALLAFL